MTDGILSRSGTTMQDTIETFTTNPRFFDEATALRLTQAFAQQDDLHELLRLLYVQLRALCYTSGLTFECSDRDIDISYGQARGHHASYNLQFRDERIGTLTRYFARPQQEQDIHTGEDLIGFALLPLRNAVKLHDARQQPSFEANNGANHESLSADEKLALAEVSTISQPDDVKADTLVLVSLDDYQNIVAKSGGDWADIIMSSVHQQLERGLRSADGVYHIGDELIAVLLPKTSETQALLVAQKIRVLVASLHLQGNELQTQLTASMGISSSQFGASAEDVMANAKLALAQAQSQGKNQVKTYDPREEKQAG